MTIKHFLRWSVSDKNGAIVIGQSPNATIIVGTLSAIISLVVPGLARIICALIGFGALFTWAWLEIVDGTTPLRRFTGGLFMLALIVLSALLIMAIR